MQVVKETLSPCQVSLQISVESDRVAQAVDKAYREFSKHIAVPGFRKGRAPLAFVKPRVPEDQLRERTVELLVEPAYKEAIEQEQVAPFAAPSLELVSIETQSAEPKFEFKAVVPLPPVVELGEYRNLEIDRERYEIQDDAVEKRIEQIRNGAAQYPLINDRPAQMGDVVICDLTITPEDKSEPGQPVETAINLGDPRNVPGIDEQLVGMMRGDEKSFRLTYPDDYESAELAGKEAGIFVKLHDIHEKKLPALDDEFAKQFGKVDTMDAMRSAVRADLERQMSGLADSLLETRLVEKIVSVSTINYPDIIVKQEVESDVHEFLHDLERRGIELKDYLEDAGQTEAKLLEDFTSKAILRVRRGLVLGEIARKENLTISAGDIDAEVDERAAANRTTSEAVRAFIDVNGQIENVARAALTKKVLGFLKAAAIITEKVLDPDAPINAASADTPKDEAAVAEAAPAAQ